MKKFIGMVALLAMSSQGVQAFDMVVSGPGGEVILYYRDGDSIVVKNCGNTSTAIKDRSNCQGPGPENKVPINSFKRALKAELLLQSPLPHSNSVDPDALSQQQSALQKQLDGIKAYIHVNEQDHPDAGAISQRAQLQKALDSVQKQLKQAQPNIKAREAAIQNANSLISDLVDKKISSSIISYVAISSTGADKRSYDLLKNFDASKRECGTDEILNGTPETPGGPSKAGHAAWLEKLWVTSAVANVSGGLGARMKDCARYPGYEHPVTNSGQRVIWKLVARQRDPATGEFHEVWQDSHTLKLWCDTLDGAYTHSNAPNSAIVLNENNCTVDKNADAKNCQVQEERACASAEAKRANAKVDDKSWGLPTIEEFDQANKDGINQVLPNMNHWFWSASLNSHDPDDVARVFDGNVGVSVNYYRDVDDSVRCVGR